jgi:hypothetical protein
LKATLLRAQCAIHLFDDIISGDPDDPAFPIRSLVPFHFHELTSRTMHGNTRERHVYTELDILAATTAYKSKEFTSVRACADPFSIPFATFHVRLYGTTSPSHVKEPMQILSVPEEKILVRWTTYLTRTDFPASPALVVQMAEESRSNRYWLSKTTPPFYRPISKS